MIEVGVATMGWSFMDVARWAGEHGVRWLEVMIGPTFGQDGAPEMLDLGELLRHGPRRVQDVLDRHGLAISALAPMLNLLHADPAVRRERAAMLRQTIDVCTLLDVDLVVIYGGSCSGMYLYGLPAVGSNHPSNTIEENMRLFREVMTPLAAYAESNGVRIALETAPRGGGYGNIAHNPELWDRLFEAVPSPALGLSFDPSHLVWLQIGPVAEVIRSYGSRIYHVDGKDTEILRDVLRRQGILGNAWWRYRLPGHGELQWESLLAALHEVGYHGTIDIENEDPELPGLPGCAAALQYLTPLLVVSSVSEGSQ